MELVMVDACRLAGLLQKICQSLAAISRCVWRLLSHHGAAFNWRLTGGSGSGHRELHLMPDLATQAYGCMSELKEDALEGFPDHALCQVHTHEASMDVVVSPNWRFLTLHLQIQLA